MFVSLASPLTILKSIPLDSAVKTKWPQVPMLGSCTQGWGRTELTWKWLWPTYEDISLAVSVCPSEGTCSLLMRL